jgi:hypothetical protein
LLVSWSEKPTSQQCTGNGLCILTTCTMPGHHSWKVDLDNSLTCWDYLGVLVGFACMYFILAYLSLGYINYGKRWNVSCRFHDYKYFGVRMIKAIQCINPCQGLVSPNWSVRVSCIRRVDRLIVIQWDRHLMMTNSVKHYL